MLRDCILFVFELRTGLQLELCTQALRTADQAYLYLHLYLRDTVHCLLAYCLVDPKN